MQAVPIFPQVGTDSTAGGWDVLDGQITPFNSTSQSTNWREEIVDIQEAVETITQQVSDVDFLVALQQVQDLHDELFHSTAWPHTFSLLDDAIFDSLAQTLQPFLEDMWSLLDEVVHKPDSNIFSAFIAGITAEIAAEISPLTEFPEPEDTINGIKEALRRGDFSSARLLLMLQVEIGGVKTEAVIDTGGIYFVCTAQIANRLNLDEEDALDEDTVNQRKQRYRKALPVTPQNSS